MKYWNGLLLSLILLFFFSACKKNTNYQQNEEKVNYGGTLSLMQDLPHSLDPLYMRNIYESTILNQIFNGLLDIDDNLNVVPSIAKYWEISEDRKTYKFYLRNDVFFHNGRKVSAEDFVFTFERILRFSLEDYFLGIEYLKFIKGADDFLKNKEKRVTGLKALDSLTLEITLTEECSPLLSVLSMNNFSVVPKEEVENNPDFSVSPVGTGPFKFGSWKEKNKIILLANENYFDGRPYLDSIIFYTPEQYTFDEEIDRFINKELDITKVSIKRYDELKNSDEYQIIQRPELSILFLGINKRISPFNDVNLRRAIYYAINNDSFTIIYGTSRFVAQNFIPPGLLGYDPTQKTKTYNLELAKKYLNTFKIKNGKYVPELKLYTIVGNKETEIINNLMKIDLKMKVIELPWIEFTKKLDYKKLPMFTLGWVADFPDPDAFFYNLIHSKGSANAFGLTNTRIDSLLELGKKETNTINRIEIYQKIEKELASEAVIVPLYYGINTVAVHNYIRNFNISPLGFMNLNLTKVWKQK